MQRHPFLFSSTPTDRSVSGFSLTELLVVVAVMSALATLSLPSLNSLLSSSKIRSGSVTLANIFEAARAHAIARNSYVYVGLLQSDLQTVTVGMAESFNGEADITNVSAITRMIFLPQMELRASSAIKNVVSLPNAATESDAVQESDLGTLLLPFGKQTLKFSYIVCFSPSGQATVKQSNSSRYIQIGLAPASHPQSKNLALVQITGLTGTVNVYMP